MGKYEKKEFLGRGWSFPVEPDKMTGRIKESAYEDNIADSIKIILQTQRGERVMRPDFGCDLKSYAFSEMNYTNITQIEQEVKNALILWEPRIIDIEVQCVPDKKERSLLLINIEYVVRNTNNPYNMVFPFYLNETA